MRTTLKFILISIGFLIFAFLILILRAFPSNFTSSTGLGGPIGVILMIAFLAGARAIWNYNPTKKD
jgi:hypothetical protein